MEESESQINNKEKNINNKENTKYCLVVGIGASAGGIQALIVFFEHVPEDSGAAYVVILHLSPDYDSQLTEVLQTVSKIPVTKVVKEVTIVKNNVYVVPPNGSLKMWDNHIKVEPIHTVEERRAPVDIFFRSLAESHGANAAAVVLSGTGANGSMGLKRVKEKGGAVFVQNPREAEYTDMPRNAIATNLVDEILNVADIPAKIVSYLQGLRSVEIPLAPEELEEEDQAALRGIFTQLRVRTGHDFSNYKRATILRRIERRINVRNLPSLPAYASFLRDVPDEAQALLKDFLISVTNFFRDKEAFEYIEKVIIPKVLADKAADNQVRIWVAGCATGEEAYSLAMILCEKLQDVKDVPSVQIFATDIDEAAIATAREGFYTLNDAADVSPERLHRFFTTENEGYRIKRELRELVLFANHNVIKDPAFSHLDMVTCRNMLIYFNQVAQNRVMETFHFALNPGGYLFVGSSESIAGANDLYVTVSKEYQVFQSRHVTTKPIPVPESSLSYLPRIKFPEARSNDTRVVREQGNRALERISVGDLHQRLLEQYAPPSILINEKHDVVHLSENAGRFLRVSGGEPSNNVIKLIKPELRLELRTALYQALQKQMNIEVKNLLVTIDSETEVINIHVRPLLRADDTARGFILIIFETSLEKASRDVVEITPLAVESITFQLEEEITNVKSQLHASNEQFEIQTEELKASNEELQAMNEELRSSTEELETSKEELQSINEELITVNQELKIKVEEVSQSNNNFQNLINSIDIGTIFLDRNLRIQLFSPAVKDVFNLIQQDIGRPLSDITSRLESNNLLVDAEAVLQNLQTIEREVFVKGGRTYLMQVQPYRTEEDHIKGVVIVFVNITQSKQAEEALRASDERLRLLVESASDFAIITLDKDGIVNTWNIGAEKLFGWKEQEILGQFGAILFTVEDRANLVHEAEMKKAIKDGHSEDERWHIKKDGSKFFASGVMNLLKDGNGFAKIARDMTAKLESEKKIRDSEERYRIALEAGELATWDWNLLTNKIVWNEQHYRLFGIDHKEEFIEPEYFLQFIYQEDLAVVKKQLYEVTGEKGIYNAEFRIERENDKKLRWMNGYGRVTERDNGKPVRVSGVMYDNTERREAEYVLQTAQNSLNTALEAAQMGIWNMNITTGVFDRSLRHDQLLGYSELLEEWNTEKAKQYIHPDDKIKFDNAYNNLLLNGTFELEARIIHPDGNNYWIYYYGHAFKDEEGKSEHAAGVIFDITDRKTVEKQKDEFIGIASHELKTPVTSIKAYVEILQEMFTEVNDLKSADLMAKLDNQVDRLTKLIKDLLDVTKVSEGQLQLTKESFSIEELTRSVVEEMQRTSRQHHIKLNMSSLPVVVGDKERLGQVIVNLISNAIKYTPGTNDIEVTAHHQDNKIMIAVKDSGIGMAPGTVARLFQRFYRSDNASVRSYPGLGLGLFISMEIMKRHSGTITVESEKGKGSTFTMILPFV